MKRREFIGQMTLVGAGLSVSSVFSSCLFSDQQQAFKISLAQWSLHRSIFDGKIDNLDFAKVARQEFNIEAIEYVNQFFKDKARENTYLSEMKKRAEDQKCT